jgi:hypothetical protein
MELVLEKETFTTMLQGLVASGCQFKALEVGDSIIVIFNGSY